MRKKWKLFALFVVVVIIVVALLYHVIFLLIGNGVANGYEELYSSKNMKIGDVKLISEHGEYVFKAFNNYDVRGDEDWNGDVLKYIDNNYKERIIIDGEFYSFSKKGKYLVIHNMDLNYIDDTDNSHYTDGLRTIKYQGHSFSVLQDEYVLLDSENGQLETFQDYESFFNRCQLLKVKFDMWYYNGKPSKRIDTGIGDGSLSQDEKP